MRPGVGRQLFLLVVTMYLWLLLVSASVVGGVAATAAGATVEVQDQTDDTVLHWYKVCTQDDVINLPFCNISLDLDVRVQDYVSRIPVEKQITMMGNTANSYKQLHIPAYQWWNEGLHGAKITPCIILPNDEHGGGYYKTYCPTSFPCPSGLGNSFNISLYKQIGQVISKEALAFSQYRRNTDITDNLQHGDGLTLWAPTINLQRDPRWGRNQEGM